MALAGKLHRGHPYALPWAKDDSAGFKVIIQEQSGQPTTWTQSVVASERRVSEWANTEMNRRTSTDTALNDSEKCSAQLWARNKHPSNISPTPHSSGSQLSVCYVCGVCGMDTRKPTWVVMWMDWNRALESVFLISIPWTEWLVHGPYSEKHWCAFNTW